MHLVERSRTFASHCCEHDACRFHNMSLCTAGCSVTACRNWHIRRALHVKASDARLKLAEEQLQADEEMARRLQAEERAAYRGQPIAATPVAGPLSEAAFEQLYGARFVPTPRALAVHQRPRGTLHVTVVEGINLEDQARSSQSVMVCRGCTRPNRIHRHLYRE
jgi:hypothetical protein